ncbi:MAG TPA: hypothetical protein DIV86_03895 [Alphaproteobacteria bacterium]|nr:hypothetical protein [Alphaproteobacteria bacterium]
MEKKILTPTYIWVALTCIFLSIILGLSLPIQTDEITWDIPNHSAIKDGYKLTTLLPQCHLPSRITEELPVLWYPFAWFNHIIFMQIEHHLWLRIVATSSYVLFLLIIYFICRNLTERLKLSAISIFVIFSCFLGLDIMPLLMQVNRPEQTLLLGIAIFILLGIKSRDFLQRSKIIGYFNVLAFIFTVLLVFPSHAKSIAILPVAFVCGTILFKDIIRSKVIILLLLAFITFFAIQSAMVWIDRYECSNSPETKKIIDGHSLPINKITSEPTEFILAAVISLILGLASDLFSSGIIYGSGWLPVTITDLPNWLLFTDMTLGIIYYFLRIIIFFSCVWFFSCIFLSFIKNKNIKFDFDITFFLIASSVLLSLMGVMMVTGTAKAWYHPALNIPLLWFAALLLLAANGVTSKNIYSLPKFTLKILVIIFTISTFFLLIKYHPYFTQAESIKARGQNKFMVLIPTGDFSLRKQVIFDTYKQCGLPPVSETKNLIVDDYTYPVLRTTKFPMNFQYITNIFYNKIKSFDDKKLLKFMDEYNSPGFIINCNHLPNKMKKYNIIKNQGYCCLNNSKR